eukprot:TRINITY_DN13646_c0_g1_i2.p1 TRINITY_DN13646_c0_g1~~TRINITY_DN13646_c0_g1_i2.p1  ORF type:complete len:192 (+),score=19.75 TRINITY_DN13646_c0_g1_i2:66-641(+)
MCIRDRYKRVCIGLHLLLVAELCVLAYGFQRIGLSHLVHLEFYQCFDCVTMGTALHVFLTLSWYTILLILVRRRQMEILRISESHRILLAHLIQQVRAAQEEEMNNQLAYTLREIEALESYELDDEAVKQHAEQECIICFEGYQKKRLVIKLKDCGHFYHKDCISKWLLIKNMCPMCRTPVFSQNITYQTD